MPDQRQPDQPIDRNRNLDRNQPGRQSQQSRQDSQSDRQQNLQGRETDLESMTNRYIDQSERHDRQSQGSSGTSGTDRESGLNMLGREHAPQSREGQRDSSQSREGLDRERYIGEESGRRSRSFDDEGLGRPYDTDDMEAQWRG